MFLFQWSFIVVVLWVTIVLSGGSAKGQHRFDSVARIEASNGYGTCFAVAKNDSSVEVWTAAHCCDGIGTSATIVWSSGERTKAVVARWKHDGKADVAKLIGNRPDKPFSVIPVAAGLSSEVGFHYHAGYGLDNRQTARQLFNTKSGIDKRVAFVPTSVPGDSGGPLLNKYGQVVAVVVEKTLERKQPRLLAIPISEWLELD